jgi:hypothetical protein
VLLEQFAARTGKPLTSAGLDPAKSLQPAPAFSVNGNLEKSQVILLA